MIDPSFLLDLFLVGTAAVLGGAVCRRIQVPEVVGYIAAGILIGPYTPPFPFVHEVDTIRAIAAFAVVFRMFALGLDFDPRRLEGRSRPAFLAGLLEVGTGALMGLGLALFFGWHPVSGLILGAALGTTSTNILNRVLTERGLSATEEGRAAGAVSLIEDLLTIGILALLAIHTSSESPEAAAQEMFQLALLAMSALTAGLVFVPLGLERLARNGSDELLALAVVGFVFGLAATSAGLGAGPAIGAFLAGIAVGSARHAPGVAARILPIRDFLTALFFVTSGMLLDPAILLEWAPIALGVALAFTPIKAAAAAVGLRLGGMPATVSARAGSLLGQTGTLGLVAAGSAFLPRGEGERLFAFAFVAWATTVAATELRVKYGPALAEAIVARRRRAVESPKEAALPRAPQGNGNARRGTLTAIGCALFFAFLATIALRTLPLLEGPLAIPAAAVIGSATALLTIPWTRAPRLHLAAALAVAVRNATLHPSRTIRSAARGLAVASPVLTFAFVGLIVLAVSSLIALAAPHGAALATLGGYAAGALALAAVPGPWRWATAQCDRALQSVTQARPDATFAPHVRQLTALPPFGLQVEGIRIAFGSRVDGRTLRDLRLREETGANVLAVLRPGSREPEPPTPQRALHAGDELVVAGTESQLAATRRFLVEPPLETARAVGRIR